MNSVSNHVSLIGNLTREPEVREFGEVVVCKVSLAVNAQLKKDSRADYFDIVLFGKAAELFQTMAKKGTKVAISGRLKQDRWENKQGEKRTAVTVNVSDFRILDRKNKSDTNNSDNPYNPKTTDAFDRRETFSPF